MRCDTQNRNHLVMSFQVAELISTSIFRTQFPTEVLLHFRAAPCEKSIQNCLPFLCFEKVSLASIRKYRGQYSEIQLSVFSACCARHTNLANFFFRKAFFAFSWMLQLAYCIYKYILSTNQSAKQRIYTPISDKFFLATSNKGKWA